MIVEGWLKRTKKSAGNLTFSKWKGLTTARQKSTGPPPGTISQRVLDQRTQMAAMKAIYDQIAPALVVGYKEWNATMGPWSAWVKHNITVSSNFSTPGNPFTVYSTLTMSQGAILAGPFVASADISLDEIAIGYSGTPTGNQLGTDILVVVVWNNTTLSWGQTVVFAEGGGQYRSSTNANISGVASYASPGDELYIWTFFYGAVGSLNEGKVAGSTMQTVVVSA